MFLALTDITGLKIVINKDMIGWVREVESGGNFNQVNIYGKGGELIAMVSEEFSKIIEEIE